MADRYESLVDMPPYRPKPEPQSPRRTPVRASRIMRARSVLRRMTRSRRRVLVTLGVGAVAAAGLGSTAVVLLTGSDGLAGETDREGSPRDAGAFADRDASYVQGAAVDLGASGVANTAAEAAAEALKATPK